MNAQELKNNINCKVNFFTAISKIVPIETQDTSDFYGQINEAVSEIKEGLSDREYHKFEQVLADTLLKTFLDDESLGIPGSKIVREGHQEKYFLMLLNENEHAPLSYAQERVDTLIVSLIEKNLLNAVVEFYTLTNTLPSIGQIFSINAYERIIQQVFKDYQQLHNKVRGSNYYLKELIYEERSNFSDEQERSFGQFNLGFCRYDTGDIF